MPCRSLPPCAIAAIAAIAAACAATRPSLAQGINPGAHATLSPAEQAAVEQVIGQWVAAHPGEIRRALQGAGGQDAAAAADPSDGMLGNPSASVSVIALLDRASPQSRSMMPLLAVLAATDQDVRVIIKELPLLSADSVTAAVAAVAARRQGDAAFRMFEASLMADDAAPGEPALAAAAAAAHLDMPRFAADRADPAIRDYLRRTRAFAESIAVAATPVFLAGSALLPGVQTLESLRAAVSDARRAAQ